MVIKFMYNGIKVDGKLYRAHYSKGGYTAQSKIPKGTITIYARDYDDFPQIEGLQIENNSDGMTDYFEKDRIRVTPDNKYYNEVLRAVEMVEEKQLKKMMLRKLSN